MVMTQGKQANYGLDAPSVILNLLIVAGAGVLLGVLVPILGQPYPYGVPVREIGFGVALVSLINAGAMVWSSKVGKVRARERLLDSMPWRGDEMVLDVGCGRGLMLLGAAHRLKTGKAVGVDIWRSEDLSGNRAEATWENAHTEGVADRVEIKDGDARQLPFPDGTFDVILSCAVIHNIPTVAEREQAIREIARVLKPGGRVAIKDIASTATYVRVLREQGLVEVRREGSRLLALLLILTTMGAVQPFTVIGRKPGGAANA
jgi:arsenite methyltransferase